MSKVQALPAKFPIPKGYALMCPKCRFWKMRPFLGHGILPAYQCQGLHPELVNPCGHIETEYAMKKMVGAEMFEE